MVSRDRPPQYPAPLFGLVKGNENKVVGPHPCKLPNKIACRVPRLYFSPRFPSLSICQTIWATCMVSVWRFQGREKITAGLNSRGCLIPF
ncbi:Uncharacterized protein TCM_029212 [Theobroma cacao]|uniref:Uncharacterized protein n=1 Tax=Theobroma cacao TaxID=3641 RepID=A0A061GCP4_THECC|nr:Uncharacterized protein TCM_029212 [Theobroma cacao]